MTKDERAVSLRSPDSFRHTTYVFVFPQLTTRFPKDTLKLCPPGRPPLATRSYSHLKELKSVKLDVLFLSHTGHRSRA